MVWWSLGCTDNFVCFNLRVLDCFFAEGVIVFYRVALSVMSLLKDQILEVFFCSLNRIAE